jgi:outer membrane protein assembly complex protein YaeT
MQGCVLCCASNRTTGGRARRRRQRTALRCRLPGGLLAALAWIVMTLPGPVQSLAAETAAVGRIVIRGNANLSDRALEKAAAAELRAYAENDGRRSDLDDAAYQMVLALRKEGYAFATVDYDVDQEAGERQAVFTVVEGPRVMVRQVTIDGRRALSREELMKIIDPGDRLAAGGLVFVAARMDQAMRRIAAIYREQGYLDARIDPPRKVFSDDRTQVDLHFQLHEGPQYRLTAIENATPAPPAAETALEELRRGWVGEPYHPRLRFILRNKLLDTLGDAGYAEAQVTVDVTREREQGAMVLAVRIESGSSIRIESIEVRGNDQTRESFVRRRLALRAGERYDRRRVRESIDTLYRTGFFNRVDITLEAGSNSGTRNLVVTLEEAASLSFFVEPGWGSYELLRLSLGLDENNLLGTGRRLGLELGASLKAHRALLRFTDPWFLETAFTADVPLFYSYREEPSFTRRDYGVTFNLSRVLGPNLSTTAAYSLRKTQQSDVDVDDEDNDADTNYDLGSVRLQFTYDNRNDPFYPTQGWRSFTALEHAARFLGGSLDFSRLTAGVRHFRSLTPRVVLGGRYTTGFIIPHLDTVNVPLAERFFNGGENSVRSFKEQELGPKDDRNNPVGGMAFNTFNLELRTLMTKRFYGAIFADLGNIAPNRSRSEQGKDAFRSRSALVSATFDDYFSDMRPALGIGAGYLLPIGPARIDLAFNPDADDERREDEWVVHFSIGMAF